MGDYVSSPGEEGESHRNSDASAGNNKNVKSARPLNIATKIEINSEKKIKEKIFIFVFLQGKLSFNYFLICAAFSESFLNSACAFSNSTNSAKFTISSTLTRPVFSVSNP